MVSLGFAALASALGAMWFALAMPVHWRQVYGGAALMRTTQGVLRMMGTLGLGVSLGLCLWANHASMAVLVWVMLLALGLVLTAFVLAWQPAGLRVVWPFVAAGSAKVDRA